ncbi:MAG: type II toxin-antitoxin system PemK/MazF family toxin [bacterium]
MTSQPQIGKTEYKIVNWQKAGLLFESWVRVGKIATLDKSLIDRKLGVLVKDEIKKI